MQITAELVPASETACCRAAVSLTRLVHGTCAEEPADVGTGDDVVGTDALIPGGSVDATRLLEATLPHPSPVDPLPVDVVGALEPKVLGTGVEPLGQPSELEGVEAPAVVEFGLELPLESFFDESFLSVSLFPGSLSLVGLSLVGLAESLSPESFLLEPVSLSVFLCARGTENTTTCGDSEVA
jgi:hypothetical protein